MTAGFPKRLVFWFDPVNYFGKVENNLSYVCMKINHITNFKDKA
jgi:hypothetical protein